MKKKFSWIYILIAVIVINAIIDNTSIFEGGGMTTIVTIVPFVGFFIFAVSIIGAANKHQKKDNQEPVEPLKEEPEKPKDSPVNTYANQKLYDEESFKIDPKDYEL